MPNGWLGHMICLNNFRKARILVLKAHCDGICFNCYLQASRGSPSPSPWGYRPPPQWPQMWMPQHRGAVPQVPSHPILKTISYTSFTGLGRPRVSFLLPRLWGAAGLASWFRGEAWGAEPAKSSSFRATSQLQGPSS